jgi:hypothetical protein
MILIRITLDMYGRIAEIPDREPDYVSGPAAYLGNVPDPPYSRSAARGLVVTPQYSRPGAGMSIMDAAAFRMMPSGLVPPIWCSCATRGKLVQELQIEKRH